MCVCVRVCVPLPLYDLTLLFFFLIIAVVVLILQMNDLGRTYSGGSGSSRSFSFLRGGTRRTSFSSLPLQRKQSASDGINDVFAFSQSVQMPPLLSYTADYSQTAAGTPQSQYMQPTQPLLHLRNFRPLSQQMLLNRTMSGGSSGFGSLYNGFYGGSSQGEQNSFYGNMSSFYGGFANSGLAQPDSGSGIPVTSDTQNTEFLNYYGYGQGDANVASTASLDGPSEGELEDEEGQLCRATSSGRILRRKVSFSGVPPLKDEASQRTGAQTPKRVGSRRLNCQQAPDIGRGFSASPMQEPEQPQQQQQQSMMITTNNLAGPYSFGFTYPWNAAVNEYGPQQNYMPYRMGGENAGEQYPLPLSNPQAYPQPLYGIYGAMGYTGYNNGSPIMMQSRSMTNGFYYQ